MSSIQIGGLKPGVAFTIVAKLKVGPFVSVALLINGEQGPTEESGDWRTVRQTVTPLSDTVNVTLARVSGEGTAYLDLLTVVEGLYAGEPFDGNAPAAGLAYAGWADEPDASKSYSAKTTPPFYRARVSALYDGETVNPSAWSTPTPVGLTADGWNLKAVEVPGLAFIEVPVIGEIIQELDEDVGVFRPLDRRLPVVVAGELTGYDGSLEIRLTEQWQWETLKSLIEAQRVLLMQRPYGDQQYIRFVDKRSIGLWGTPTNPQRRVILKYVETGAP